MYILVSNALYRVKHNAYKVSTLQYGTKYTLPHLAHYKSDGCMSSYKPHPLRHENQPGLPDIFLRAILNIQRGLDTRLRIGSLVPTPLPVFQYCMEKKNIYIYIFFFTSMVV